MPDTSPTWEDHTLPRACLEGINSTDLPAALADPVPATDPHLIAAKKKLRVMLVLCAKKIVATYADREEFFDAVAALAATDTDPLYDDLNHALSLYWWYHYYQSQLLSDIDRQETQKRDADKDGKLAAQALCELIGIELGKATRTTGSARSTTKVSTLHAHHSYLTVR